MPDTDPHSRACGELSDALSTLVRINRVISSDVARRAGLAPGQIGLLGLIGVLVEARIADIADHQMVDPSVASRQVATLEQVGLVTRRADPEDRRAALVSLTDEGRAVVATARRGRLQRISAALGEWTAADLEDLAGRLGRVGEVIERAEHRRAGDAAGEPTRRAVTG